jgi:general secretion pathway protein M
MSAWARFRDALQNVYAKTLGRPFGRLAAEWERMAPRERRLAAGLLVTVIVLGAGLGMYFVFSQIDDLAEGNAEIREALAVIAKNRDTYLEAKARSQAQELRIGTEPPQLTADIEAAAREENVQIAESNERPEIPIGKKYLEHELELKIRQVDLVSLTKFLRRVETGPRLIFVNRLSIKRRFSDADQLDVELTATAFERVREAVAKKNSEGKGAEGATGEGKSPAGKATP